MPKYSYKARDHEGLAITGELELENEDVLASKLEKMGYILISSDENTDIFSADIFSKFGKVKSKEVVIFSIQLSTLLKAGITLLAGLEVMEAQIKDKFFKNTIFQIRKDISAGLSFSEALEKHPRAFSELFVNMVKAGEATGDLEIILANLAIFLEMQEKNKAKIMGALMYPLVMFSVAISVVIFLMVRVMPSFVTIFEGAGIKLPTPTKILLKISWFMSNYWLYIIASIGILIYSVYLYYKTEKGEYYLDKLKFSIPVFGNLIKKSVISRFARTFGTLMRSSVPILETLGIVEKTVGNKAVEIVVDNIRNTVREGGAVSEQLELSGLFPIMVVKMVSVGEDSGALDEMLLKVSDFYDSELETEIKTLTSIIEPIMIVTMGIIIGVIVLSVMLPMFDMMQIAKR